MPIMAKVLVLLPAFAVVGSFTSTVSLGSVIIASLIGVTALITLSFGLKYKAVALQQKMTIENLVTDRDTWRDMADVRQATVEHLHDEKQHLHEEKQTLLQRISQLNEEKARLEALPNLSLIIEQMAKEAQRADDVRTSNMELIVVKFGEIITKHERSAQERHKELVKVLREVRTA
jgi:hypothetical protein